MTCAWVEGLPKVELHLHLEGSLTPATVARLAERHGRDTAEVWPDGLPETFSFADFPDFARQYFFNVGLLRSPEDLLDTIDALAADLAANNVRYAEVTTTAYTHLHHGFDPADYAAALDLGVSRARQSHDVELRWVVDIPRDLEDGGSTVTIDFVAGRHAPRDVVGFGLGGYEVGFPPEPFAASFAKARALGLLSVPHAGETEGADSVRGALDALGAVRIGHGVRCLDDPALVARLVEADVLLEVCLTSNVLLGVAGSLAAHPLPRLLDAGVAVCLNTDDPGAFAANLNAELVSAHEVLGVPLATLHAMQLTALRHSAAPAEVRRRIADELARYPVTA